MAEQGKAVLFLLQENGRVSADTFLEDDHVSPYHAAQRLQSALEDDFPGGVWSIGQNKRSKKLMGAENMRRLGFNDADAKSAVNLI